MTSLLEIKNLSIEYKSIKEGKSSTLIAVNNVSLKINEGEIYALAGESGCGKSTMAKGITKLVKKKDGEILFDGKDIHKYNKNENKEFPKQIQMVFQNPYSSLNPKMKIGDILREPLDINTKLTKTEKESIIKEVLADVGLQTSCLDLYPHEFSGGQRQRIAIARALVLNPRLLIADEPVSALDASIQAQIINLLKTLRQKRNLTILFISHDMRAIKSISDRIMVMKDGKIVEIDQSEKILSFAKKKYTKDLIRASLN